MAAEGIKTASLAEIYAAQGHLERAIAIYEELLSEAENPTEMRGRLEALRRDLELQGDDRRGRTRADRLRDLLGRIRARRRSR